MPSSTWAKKPLADFVQRFVNIPICWAKRTSSSTLTERIISKIKASSENNSATTASYLSFTDGDVKVKVTKKVLPLINCPEGDASCMERIKALQEKISSASMNADFSGFIEILRHVQENY